MTVTYLHQFFFGFYPYICLVVFLLGSALRYDRDQYTWKASSSQLLRSKGMRVGSNLFHIGILLLFFGHVLGLLTPPVVYHHIVTVEQKVLLAMIAGGIFGSVCFVGITILLYRRLFDARIRATSTPSDILVLAVLYVQLILGLISIFYSAQHLDGGSMVALAEWSQRIITFRSGAAEHIVHEAWIFKIHLVLGMTLFLIFPFTRLVHVWSGFSAPVMYVFRSGYQIVRRRA